MIKPGTLVLHKNRLGLASPDREGRILVSCADGENLRLREKDVLVLPADRLATLPRPLENGDFQTAWSMLESMGQERGNLGWKDFAELVYGDASAESLAACALAAASGAYFRIEKGLPEPLTAEEKRSAEKKEEEREREADRRESFLAWLAASIKRGARQAGDGNASDNEGVLGSLAEKGWTKYIAEIENLALGRTQGSSLAAAAGIRETAEAAHRALVSCGIWTRDYNPWPIRASCSLKPPKAEFPETESPLAHRARTDLREHRAYAIDAAWSTDPDDAVSAFDGFFWVHVADPAAYIEPGSEADEEACERGATLYLPEKVVPMLPERAVDMLGLGLAEESKALSFGIRLDDEGRISETRILPSIVRISRLSYTEADLRLGSGDTLLETLDRAATARRARRMANGAIEINLPEVSIAVEKGNPRFVPIEPTRSGEIVREMMLMAGEAAAAWAIQMRVPFVYASQEGRTESGDDGQAEPALLSAEYKKRKSMRAGGFGVEPLAHRGLGLPFYSQVTSPLRRYQDLLTHQQIRRVLASQPHLDEDELARRCLIASRGAASTRQAERDSRLHWTIRYLERHPEWVSEAVVLEAREGGAWILIPEMGLECRLATRLHLEEDARIRVGLLSSSLSDLEIVMEQRP